MALNEHQKRKAEGCPWYLLATLYGVPERHDEDLQAKNRVAWNHFVTALLDDDMRAKLPAAMEAQFSSTPTRSRGHFFWSRKRWLATKPWAACNFHRAYEPCGAWANALWRHAHQPDGNAYQSRHDPAQICLALFERPDLALQAGPFGRLTDQLPTVAKLLSAYGKSITGVPP